MRLRPYPRYKPSGIDWLGDIPEHWELRQLRHVCRMQSGEAVASDMLSEDAEYPVFGGNGIRGFSDQFTHEGRYVLIGRQGALWGNINSAAGRFWATEHAVVVMANRGTDVNWLGRLLYSMKLNQYSISAAQPGLAVDHLKAVRVPVPPSEEQRSIEAHVGAQTSRLDDLIAKKHALIEKLQEKRSALISRVVTRGLPPDAARAA